MIMIQKTTGSAPTLECCRCLLRLLRFGDILLRLIGRQAHLLDDRVRARLDARRRNPAGSA